MVKAVTPIPFVKARFFDRCGKPLTGGKVYTYGANTTTDKTTYKDPYGLTPNTNPIILDAAGEADIYLDGTYRIRITDRNDVLVNDVAKIGSWFSDNLQDTLDNISGAMDDAIKPMLQSLDDVINTAAAAGAGANGWTDTLIAVSENVNQRQINDGLESIAQLTGIKNPRNGMRAYVKSYHAGLNKGGGTFVCDTTKSTINDGGVIINGWVRQLDSNEIDPVCFGAKADFDGTNKTTAYDDRKATQDTIDYLAKNGGGKIVFGSGNYWLNSLTDLGSDRTWGGHEILLMMSNVSYECIANSKVWLGNFFHDKSFHLFSGLQKSAWDTLDNIHFKNMYVTSLMDKNYNATQTGYNRRVIIEFQRCTNVSVKDSTFINVDTSNGVGVGDSFNNASKYAEIDNCNFINLVKTGETANNDHTTVYMASEFGTVSNCKFICSGDRGWRIACPVELHHSNTTFKNSFVYGYVRGGWFVADDAQNTRTLVENQTIQGITGFVNSYGVNIDITKPRMTLKNINLLDCTYLASHYNTDWSNLYNGHQGLFIIENRTDVAASYIRGFTVKGNKFSIDKSKNEWAKNAFLSTGNSSLIYNLNITNNDFTDVQVGFLNGLRFAESTIANNLFAIKTSTTASAFMKFDFKYLTSISVHDNTVRNLTNDFFVEANYSQDAEHVYLGKNKFVQTTPKVADYKYPDGLTTTENFNLDMAIYNIKVTIPDIAANSSFLKANVANRNDIKLPYFCQSYVDSGLNGSYIVAEQPLACSSNISNLALGLRNLSSTDVYANRPMSLSFRVVGRS